MKKVLALILALALGLSLLAGCKGSEGGSGGKESGGEAITELTLPLTKEKKELTVWFNYSGSVVADLNEIESVKKMEELTGVHINWIPIEQQQVGEKLGIMLTSGEYPDIIYPGSTPYPGGVEKGVSDGVIREDMNELIEKYMPNYMAYLKSSETARKQATSDNGKKQIIKVLVGEDFNIKAEGTYQGLAYRKDLLEGLGLSEPKTVAEWHDALVKAKENGMDTPFVLHENGGSHLSLSWGVETINTNYLQLDGNKVLGSAVQDGFGEYLETMRQWYSEGLIDPNFTSFNYYLSTPGSVEANQHLLYSFVLSAFTGNNYAAFHMVNNQDEYLQPIVSPAVKDGDKPVQSGGRVEAKDTIFISSSCKDPELAAKWIDFNYTKEGELLNWYGIEGETYEMVDGKPQFTEKVLNNDTPPSDYLQKYALNWGNSWFGKHNTVASNKVNTGNNQQQDAVDIWSAPEKNIAVPQGITLTEDESDAITSKMTAVQTLISEYVINYIIGTDSTSFEDFKAKVLEYGYQEVIDTYQKALDRYNAR
ncbi:MAG: extracellular solute-binding protein [Lachnospiraceae bacterium]|nr:extracellular solute-binding protein [Lachnospiraceae bacterium]